MPLAQVAMAAGTAAVHYGPAVYDKAKQYLSKATNGKVSNASDIVNYVGKSNQRMTVVADSLIRAGVQVDGIFPADIAMIDPAMKAMKAAAQALAYSLSRQFEAGADKVIPAQSAPDAAADVIRLRRVKAVLSVYGSPETYFLCHPNGGVPASDFAFAQAVRRAL